MRRGREEGFPPRERERERERESVMGTTPPRRGRASPAPGEVDDPAIRIRLLLSIFPFLTLWKNL